MVWLILRKEWQEVFKDKLILITALLLPILFIALTVGTLYFMEQDLANGAGSTDTASDPIIQQLMAQPQYEGASPDTVLEILILNQYLLYFLMLPLIIPVFVAVYSIIGEKQQRTLEPLLATPISTWELLLGKTLAGAIPAVLITWVSYAITLLTMVLTVRPEVYAIMYDPMWLLAMLLLVPFLTIMAVTVGIIISSRVNDIRLAEQMGGLLVLPLVGLTIPVVMGRLLLSLDMFILGTVIVALLDVGLLYIGVQLFQRETILTRWK